MFWQSLHSSVSPMDCLSFGEEGDPIGHWYGGGENLQVFPNKAWPLEKGHIEKSPFITGDEVSLTDIDKNSLKGPESMNYEKFGLLYFRSALFILMLYKIYINVKLSSCFHKKMNSQFHPP